MIELRNFVKDIKPYKPGKPIEEVIRELGLTGEVVKLASNENPLGTSPMAARAINQAIRSLNIYPDDNCFYLKQKLSKKSNLPMKNIIVGNGSVELIELIFKAYVNPYDEVIMSDPSFIMYKIACQIFGGKRVAIPVINYCTDIDSIVKAINKKTKMIIIDNPINPIGTIINQEKLEFLVKNIPDDVVLVVDEAYQGYIKAEEYPNAVEYLKDHNNIIALYTLSKIYGLAGLRVGYGFSSAEIIGAMMRVRLPFNVNRIAQIAAAAALDDEDFVKKGFENNEEGKKFLYKEFERLHLKYIPTYGNFILVNFERDAKEIFESAQRKGVILRTVYEYGLPNSLRITIGTPEQNRKVIKVLEEVI